MPEWAAEQAAEITTELIDLIFLPTATNQERGVQKPGVRAAADAHSRHGEGCRSDMIPRLEDESGICFARSFPFEGALCWNSKQGSNDGNPMSRALKKKRLKDNLDDEIKLAGLEALVREELEKHLILVTYVEAKFGLGIRDSKPSDMGSLGHSDPMDVDAVNSLATGKGKMSLSPRDGCPKCGVAHFSKRPAMIWQRQRQAVVRQRVKQSKSWSKSDGNGKSKET